MYDELQRGDVVRHVDPRGLHCGHYVYPRAIVDSVDPLILMSEEGDMTWRRIKAKDLWIEQRGTRSWKRTMRKFVIVVCATLMGLAVLYGGASSIDVSWLVVTLCFVIILRYMIHLKRKGGR